MAYSTQDVGLANEQEAIGAFRAIVTISRPVINPPFIHEDFYASQVPGEELDRLLAHGWRHAGIHFYRYNVTLFQGEAAEVIPLRVRLADFKPSKSQRRVMKRNAGFNVRVRPTNPDQEKRRLFDAHKSKFRENIPDGLHDYLSEDPANAPCEGKEITVHDGDRLIAASFFDVGSNSLSSIYGMYDLSYERHGLGLFTMLMEILYAQHRGLDYYYQGYCFRCASFYDYKKRFRALEAYDWTRGWTRWENPES